MEELPVIFNPEMVRAVRREKNPKTQTRRIVKQQPKKALFGNIDTVVISREGNEFKYAKSFLNGAIRHTVGDWQKCPYGKVGDILWVRENWLTHLIHDDIKPSDLMPEKYLQNGITYTADLHKGQKSTWMGKTRPSIFLPRRFARTFLKIISIRVERVQDITEEDALAEGITTTPYHPKGNGEVMLTLLFQELWDSINKDRGYGWEVNPFVWCITFERVDHGEK